MKSARLYKLEPLWKFLDDNEIDIKDLLVYICATLEKYNKNKFTYEKEVGYHKYKCTFKKGKGKYPFKVL